ncbi:DUF885 domain-containing protein [Hyphococcus sp.]|uniref:DUF885 domain-containing protein n=1 Tax=Hyphococcus sp. TaxID=2038636 RepID=UPI003CCB8964
MVLKTSAALAPIAFVFSTAAAFAQAQPVTADAGFARRGITECKTDLHYLNQVSGWQTSWPGQWSGLVRAGAGFEDAAARWEDAPEAIDTFIDNLTQGIENEQTAPHAVVLRVLQQTRDLAQALGDRDARYFSDADGADVWNELLENAITPAVRAASDFLENDYLPYAAQTPGLSAIENGEACFQNTIEFWTTLSTEPAEIKTIGARLLEDTRRDLVSTGEDGETFDKIMTRLRTGQENDKTTSAELIALSQAALDRAHEHVTKAFSKSAPHRVVVETMAAHLQDSAPAGYYNPPGENGTAAYIINPARPGERRLMAEVIAFHEGVPGHHLFFDYPREVESEGFNAGLLEGWALYSEYVADEIGLYSSTLDRQGMMAKHLWAASRLIIEPGLHLEGWSREEAVAFMLDNTLMSRAEAEIEVDRYIAMPGQSLSYMLGADFIMSERETARAALGEAFDIKAFHDAVLLPGVRPLPQLREDIRAWTEKQAG